MKSIILKTLLVTVFAASASLAFASNKAELNLWKFDPFFYGSCGFCGEFVGLEGNKDREDISDFSLYNQSGYYSIVLKGSKGTRITLFGSQEYGTERGYLIIIKNDDSPVQIDDLESFPEKTWTSVEPKGKHRGAYSVYYQPYPRFKNNIGSVKWGSWEDAPAPPA